MPLCRSLKPLRLGRSLIESQCRMNVVLPEIRVVKTRRCHSNATKRLLLKSIQNVRLKMRCANKMLGSLPPQTILALMKASQHRKVNSYSWCLSWSLIEKDTAMALEALAQMLFAPAPFFIADGSLSFATMGRTISTDGAPQCYYLLPPLPPWFDSLFITW